jgi:hypothetical protein
MMEALKEVYDFLIEVEKNLKGELERVEEWQRKARERMKEDGKWLGYIDYGELEAASKEFFGLKAQLAMVKSIKEKIKEVMVKER